MELVGVQNKKSRRRTRITVVMCLAAVLMLVVARGSFAAPKEDNKITICHAKEDVKKPYVSVTDSLDGSNGNSDNDHTSHVGPLASSEEVAQQLKDDHIAWGDIIPPYGDFPGMNWTEEGQAIYNNDCSFEVASDDGTDAQDDSADEQDDSADAQDDSSDSQDDSADAQDDSSDSQDDSADAQDDSSDSQDDSADAQDDSSDSQDDSADEQDDSVDDGSDVQSDDSVADDDGSTPSDDGGEVLGNTITKKPLATTGSETTVLALIGFAMLMVGATLRFGRFGRQAYATASSTETPAELLAKAFEARSRHWTCRK
jgi:hypothetical protein